MSIRALILTMPLVGCALGPILKESTQPMQQSTATSAIRTHSRLEPLDGREIVVIGTFRKSLTPLKKRGPGEFLGHAHIEMDGGFIVELGKRAPSEFESYTGQVVGVTGTLDYDPYKHARESNAEHARVISGPPQLHDIVSIEVRLCPLR